ncbi:43247_t:CDS:1, partial [Gigaspora margarita]
KNRVDGSSQSSGSWFKEGDTGLAVMPLDGIFQKRTDLGEGSGKDWAAPDDHFIALGRSLEKSMQATLERLW